MCGIHVCVCVCVGGGGARAVPQGFFNQNFKGRFDTLRAREKEKKLKKTNRKGNRPSKVKNSVG